MKSPPRGKYFPVSNSNTNEAAGIAGISQTSSMPTIS